MQNGEWKHLGQKVRTAFQDFLRLENTGPNTTEIIRSVTLVSHDATHLAALNNTLSALKKGFAKANKVKEQHN